MMHVVYQTADEVAAARATGAQVFPDSGMRVADLKGITRRAIARLEPVFTPREEPAGFDLYVDGIDSPLPLSPGEAAKVEGMTQLERAWGFAGFHAVVELTPNGGTVQVCDGTIGLRIIEVGASA